MLFHVRDERQRQGISLDTMAAHLRDRYGLHIDKAGLSRRERQLMPYSVEEIFYIREYLNVPLDRLVELEPHERPTPCQEEPTHA
jgi:transcriptional regulator with XRE-family HTH domain